MGVYLRVDAQPITTAGIYHNAGLGLISLSSDGSNWITIADKNLGATQIYNNGDALSEANCGKYYQWGNNYGFPFTSATLAQNSTVNVSGYGPGNYFNSNGTFYGQNTTTWISNDGSNLWGDTTNTNAARRGPCDEGYHIPSNTEATSLFTVISLLGTGTDTRNKLKIPLNGYINNIREITDRGTYPYIWTSTSVINSFNVTTYGKCFYLYTATSNGNCNKGMSIRPFKNEAVQPDSSRTVLYQPS